MVKKIVLVLLFVSMSFSATLESTIRDLVNAQQYEQHKSLIDLLFQQEEDFYIGDRVDVMEVARVLKENGLLELFYDQPTVTQITFKANSKHTLFLKIINDTLQQMGFTYYFIDSVAYSEGSMEVTISYSGDYAIDPLILSQRLQKHNVTVASFRRDGDFSFVYGINMHNTKLDVQQLTPGRDFSISRAIDEVVLDVSLGTQIVFEPLSGSFWYPEVILYDKNLNIIDVITDDRVRRSLYVQLTNQTHYVSISDLYQMENLNGGLRVRLRGER